jgi:hypothetical protein
VNGETYYVVNAVKLYTTEPIMQYVKKAKTPSRALKDDCSYRHLSSPDWSQGTDCVMYKVFIHEK